MIPPAEEEVISNEDQCTIDAQRLSHGGGNLEMTTHILRASTRYKKVALDLETSFLLTDQANDKRPSRCLLLQGSHSGDIIVWTGTI